MIRSRFYAALAFVLVLLTAFTPLFAQQGYPRPTGQGYIFAGPSPVGICGESSYNAGPDVCWLRVGAGQFGFNPGNPSTPVATIQQISPNAFLNPPGAASTSTSTSGGSIAAGTYRVAVVHLVPSGGSTTISSDSSSTQATTGSTSTLTVTAPTAVVDGIGYAVLVSAAGGGQNTEIFQPTNTAVCAGAFSVPILGAVGCPYGTNAVFTTLTTTGLGVPGATTGGFVDLTWGAQAAVTTVTTAQTMLTIPLRAGAQNVSGMDMQVCGEGVFTDTTNTPQITIQLVEGGITPVTVQTAALNATAVTNGQFGFCFDVTTTATTGTSATLEAHGWLDIDDSGVAPASNPKLSRYRDTNTAVSSAIDLTAQNNLLIQVVSTASLNSMTLRSGRVRFIKP